LILTALIVSIKTFALWLRTRELPELLLSTMLVPSTVIGLPLAIACAMIPASEMLPMHIVYPLIISPGFACLLFFTPNVSSPKALWAQSLTGATRLMIVGSVVAYLIEVSGESSRKPQEMLGLRLVDSGAIAVTCFWTTFESLSYYRQLRRQLRLGLADRLVVNRVLLWGLMGLAAGIAVVLDAGGMLMRSFMQASTLAT
jgi:hypothetical protein